MADHKDRLHPQVEEYRKTQTERADNPHMTNTASTISNEMPSVGEDKPPPEFISEVDPNYVPKDSEPENTERMTGGQQQGQPDKGPNADLGVGELEGVEVKIKPLRREGEDPSTMRARLLYQSRKRGILESDLLLSTFASTHLQHMTPSQMRQYDHFLDENDWDIYYWATQPPSDSPTSQETAEGSIDYSPPKAPSSSSDNTSQTTTWEPGASRPGEWAQTVGTFKPAYRPVPQRWRNSEILKMLREHVKERRSGGEAEVVDSKGNKVDDGLGHVKSKGTGMGRMPDVQVFDS
ncbi:putative tpr repeat protein [Phaeomoniella chlamydospora]|uniref:Succinate dehydrogenase assembly factor 2, mitochondrial n=1 Tax=Phaeomoniella chlamydospora TaxID=158046 RepID=A0A0G2DWM6_PHACM|nr:putative tpr repeat protein [Phaeomoniella chlamydospora]